MSVTVIVCEPMIWLSYFVIKNVGEADTLSVRLPTHWVVNDVTSSKILEDTGFTGPFVVVGPVLVGVVEVVVVVSCKS